MRKEESEAVSDNDYENKRMGKKEGGRLIKEVIGYDYERYEDGENWEKLNFWTRVANPKYFE